jgi:MerR family transcriptional regulator, light-induced transcriptional regulator
VNIQAIARRTGVNAATLRKWEQRYGVLKPERTAGAHRRYSDRDVFRVEWLKARLDEGYRIGEAADLLGRAELAPAATTNELQQELVAAAKEADSGRIMRGLDQAFALFPVETVLLDVIDPALVAVGELWAAGDLHVVHEHHFSELVRRRLSSLLDVATGPHGPVVLCCVPGERHELGLLMTAVLLSAGGWQPVYLGADVPLEEAARLADTFGARALCVTATMSQFAEAAEADLQAIEKHADGLTVVRGGAAFGGLHPAEVARRLSATG